MFIPCNLGGKLQNISIMNFAMRTFYNRSQHLSKLDFNDLQESASSVNIDIASRSEEKHPLMLMGCVNNGFRFSNMTVKGPVALVDKLALRWNVEKAEDITEESFALFKMIYPKIDLIVVGTGEKAKFVPPQVRESLKRDGISLEVQSTKNACGTFNVLLQQKASSVAAALIPFTMADQFAPKLKQIKNTRPERLT